MPVGDAPCGFGTAKGRVVDLMEPLGLGWRERRERELALMADLVPLLNKRGHGRDISGLNAYEQGGAR